MSLKRLAKRWAPVPKPGKSLPHVATMAISTRSLAIAGAAIVEAAATPPKPTKPFFNISRLCISVISGIVFIRLDYNKVTHP